MNTDWWRETCCNSWLNRQFEPRTSRWRTILTWRAVPGWSDTAAVLPPISPVGLRRLVHFIRFVCSFIALTANVPTVHGNFKSFIARVNSFKPSGVKWLPFKVFGTGPHWSNPLFFNFWTFGHSGAQSWAPECPNVIKFKKWVRPVWRWTLW